MGVVVCWLSVACRAEFKFLGVKLASVMVFMVGVHPFWGLQVKVLFSRGRLSVPNSLNVVGSLSWGSRGIFACF